LNVIEDEELGVTLATAVGVREKAPPGDSGGAFVVGLTCYVQRGGMIARWC
jgi:hypothetical protein